MDTVRKEGEREGRKGGSIEDGTNGIGDPSSRVGEGFGSKDHPPLSFFFMCLLPPLSLSLHTPPFLLGHRSDGGYLLTLGIPSRDPSPSTLSPAGSSFQSLDPIEPSKGNPFPSYPGFGSRFLFTLRVRPSRSIPPSPSSSARKGEAMGSRTGHAREGIAPSDRFVPVPEEEEQVRTDVDTRRGTRSGFPIRSLPPSSLRNGGRVGVETHAPTSLLDAEDAKGGWGWFRDKTKGNDREREEGGRIPRAAPHPLPRFPWSAGDVRSSFHLRWRGEDPSLSDS